MSKTIPSKLGLKLLNLVAAGDFATFQRLMHPIVNGGPYVHCRHARALAEVLRKVATGELKRVCVAIAPRHYKSYQASITFPAFLLGMDPSLKIVAASYGQDLAEDFAARSRQIMQSDEYRAVFPDTHLSSKTPAIAKLRTTKGGHRIATSVGGPMTGKGCDVLIVDDPMKAGDANSDLARDTVETWFKSTAITRFDDPATARVVVAMQRLHQDDLIGRLKVDPDWFVLELPAIMPAPMTLDLGLGELVELKTGEILFPEKFDLDLLDKIRGELGEAGFAAQFLQRPTPAGGHLFDLGKAQRFELPAKSNLKPFEAVLISVDCGVAAGQHSDYTAITSWGVSGRQLYLLSATRGRWKLTKTLDVMEDLIKRMAHPNRHVLIEAGGSGTPLYHMLEERGHEHVWIWHPKNNKEARADFANLRIEQGVVLLPEDAPWLDEFEMELSTFPHGKNDDYVDSFTQVPWNMEGPLGWSMRVDSFPTSKLAH